MNMLREQTEQLLHIRLTDSQVGMFRRYEELLMEWNEKFNLTAIREPEIIRVKHFLDSLTCILAMRNLTAERVIDVGTGAGFPGLPLKVFYPDIQLTLVESIGKKARFCQMVSDTLHFERVTVWTGRAEELAHQAEQRESYDWAVARAVANLPILMEYLLPFVRVGGFVLAQKGVSAYEEAQSAANAIKLLGGELMKIIRVELPGVVDERYLILIQKKYSTPPMYPRQAGLPVKKPIV